MSTEHKCFPRTWIGETPIRMNDYTFQIGNNSARQVSIPSGYGKATNAYWIPDGVLVICSDTNGVKFNFVGYQRSFISYANETEPHDLHAYRKAIEECKRMRGEINSEETRISTKNNNLSHISASSKTKSKLNISQALRRAKSSIDTFNSISDSSAFEADANAIGQNFINNMLSQFNQSADFDDDTSWLDNYEDDEEEFDPIEAIRDLEDDDVPEVSERLLGEDYDSLSHKDQTTKILSLYKSQRISAAQAIDQLELIIGFCSYDVNNFVADFTEKLQTASVSEWTQKFVDKFNISINKQIHRDSLFPELKKEFEYEENIDESIKPNGFLDFATKNRNKRVENLKDKRSDLRSDINYDMRNLRTSLISIIDELKELIQNERILDGLEKKVPTTDGIFSGLKVKKEIYEEKKTTKERIKNNKESILSLNKDIKEAFKNLKDKSNLYNQVNRELFELTSAERYNIVFSIQGRSMEISKVLATNIKLTDSKELSVLFKNLTFKESN